MPETRIFLINYSHTQIHKNPRFSLFFFFIYIYIYSTSLSLPLTLTTYTQMQKSSAAQFFKSASRAISASALNATSSTSPALAVPTSVTSSTQHSIMNSLLRASRKPALRMKIIVNSRGVVQMQELSSIRPSSTV